MIITDHNIYSIKLGSSRKVDGQTLKYCWTKIMEKLFNDLTVECKKVMLKKL